MRKITSDPVPWIVGLFAVNFLVQRLSIPFLSIPVITPLMFVWMVLVLWARVAEVNARRLLLWLLATSVSGSLVILQVLFVSQPFVSVNSWAFWVAIWLPLVLQLRRRDTGTYRRALRGIGHVGLGMGALSLLFTLTQLVGIGYRDWVGQIVPAPFLVNGYVISYPIVYGSELYKSNAWITLEPSFLSFMLGVCVVAAIIARLHWVKVMVIFAGLLCTTAGSGLAIVVAFAVLTVVSGQARRLRSYAVPGIVLGALFATTLLGEAITGRLTEVGNSRSSTSLRTIEPYLYLWPQWTSDALVPLIGRGPGSSAWVINNLGILGLLVPSPAKVLFDYGLVGGVLLIALMVSAFVRTPEPAFALALAISMFTVQAAAPPLVVCVLIAVSVWSPTPWWRERSGSAVLTERRALEPPVGFARAVRVVA